MPEGYWKIFSNKSSVDSLKQYLYKLESRGCYSKQTIKLAFGLWILKSLAEAKQNILSDFVSLPCPKYSLRHTRNASPIKAEF